MQLENKQESILVGRTNGNSRMNAVTKDLYEIERDLQRKMNPTYLKTFTMAELYEEVFESRPSIIEGLLTVGTYILAGAPKLGKSFLVMQFAWHISTGTPIWGMEVTQSHVLYLALEDDKRRLQTRMYRMFGEEPTDKLHLTVYSRSIGGGLIQQIEHFIEEHRGTRLVIVDTLQKVRDANREQYSYAGDYAEIAELKKLSDKHSLCIILVHHTRKQQAEDGFDMISGTTGLMGAADGAFLLRKERRTANTASLEVSGRDQQDQKLYLKRNEESLCWELESVETEIWKEAPEPVLGQLNRLIGNADHWSGSPTELVQALGIDMKANALTFKLNANAGRLHDEYGIKYSSSRSHAGRRIELKRDNA